ncbi:hypothetical protein chiPu_0011730 [Chiloscyllium punctatum]|uniref:Uncharacterized protein n=1 Tax=Chiloscyllium punctatum TaxID=137246 RepID=A0A401SSC3_CHIPU|nr:hypothetical protein [Chiloscyllium punctatum]
MLEIRVESVVLEKHSRSSSIQGAGESTLQENVTHNWRQQLLTRVGNVHILFNIRGGDSASHSGRTAALPHSIDEDWPST